MEKKEKITVGAYFFYNGKFIEDKGLTIDTKKVFEALTRLENDESFSVRTLVEDKGFKREMVLNALMELCDMRYIEYDSKNDVITIL